MEIRVNGDAMTLPDHSSLAALLNQLSLRNARIAVELNREIVPRSEYPTCTLQEGDRVEIVQAIGGG
jgi:sulfur carrier protein